MTTPRKNGRARQVTEIGEEVQCAKCLEFWPADSEFFYFTRGRPHSWCKACYRNDPKQVEKKDRWLSKIKTTKAGPIHA